MSPRCCTKSLHDLNNYKDLGTIGIPSDAYEKHLRRRSLFLSPRLDRVRVHDFALVLSRFALDRRAV